MHPPRQSEIALDPADATRPTAYQRAQQLLRLGDFAGRDATGTPKLIVNQAKKPQRDPTAVNEQAVAQAVLYRKKYSD